MLVSVVSGHLRAACWKGRTWSRRLPGLIQALEMGFRTVVVVEIRCIFGAVFQDGG